MQSEASERCFSTSSSRGGNEAFAVMFVRVSASGGFISASSDSKALGAFFCNFGGVGPVRSNSKRKRRE